MEQARTPGDLSSAQSFSAPTGDFPTDTWWQRFADPALDALIAEGLRNSPSVARAAARVNAARAIAGEARGALLPSVEFSSSISGEKLTQNQYVPAQLIPNGLLDTGKIAGSLSFDLDLWGRNRAALAAATSEAKAAQVDAAQARLMLSSAIAQNYYDLARLSAGREVAQLALRIAEDSGTLIRQRVSQGVDTEASSKQAEARVAQARGNILALDESIALQRNALAALVGAGPDRGLTIVAPSLPDGAAIALPPQLGIDILGRRPDIVAARLRSETEAARVRVAKASFYPNLRLSAVGGLQSVGLDTLLKESSTFATFGPALSLPIFDGGTLSARYRGARAGYAQAVADYDATLIGALREVADVLARKRLIAERMSNARAAISAGEDARRLMALRYGHGLANQLQLLVAEDAVISAREQMVTLRALDVMLDIAMIRALGGGFGDMSSQSSEGGK